MMKYKVKEDLQTDLHMRTDPVQPASHLTFYSQGHFTLFSTKMSYYKFFPYTQLHLKSIFILFFYHWKRLSYVNQ